MARKISATHVVSDRDRGGHRPGMDPDTPIPQALAAVQAHWRHEGLHTEPVLERVSRYVNVFAGRLLTTGATSFDGVTYGEAHAFLQAESRNAVLPSLAEQHARRAALSALYRTLALLGAGVHDPTTDLLLPPLSNNSSRPLLDEELLVCRLCCRQVGDFRVLVWELAEAGASPGQAAKVTIGDLDSLDDPTSIRLSGEHGSGVRVVALGWGRRNIAVHVAAQRLFGAGSATPLLAAVGDMERPVSRARVAHAVKRVLQLAGLAQEPDVSATSIAQL